ncbi:hypothetical protein QW180_15940 [Vibrio sinaloensis]|nr:hypothetical protein [Vibrio sinaloensis]
MPKHGVVELQTAQGIGELRLLLPHLQNTSHERLSVFVQPPGYLSAEHLVDQGIDPNKVLLIYPQKQQRSFVVSRAMFKKSGACSNVLLWQSELEVHQARRLQVASETGDCLAFY